MESMPVEPVLVQIRVEDPATGTILNRTNLEVLSEQHDLSGTERARLLADLTSEAGESPLTLNGESCLLRREGPVPTQSAGEVLAQAIIEESKEGLFGTKGRAYIEMRIEWLEEIKPGSSGAIRERSTEAARILREHLNSTEGA